MRKFLAAAVITLAACSGSTTSNGVTPPASSSNWIGTFAGPNGSSGSVILTFASPVSALAVAEPTPFVANATASSLIALTGVAYLNTPQTLALPFSGTFDPSNLTLTATGTGTVSGVTLASLFGLLSAQGLTFTGSLTGSIIDNINGLAIVGGSSNTTQYCGTITGTLTGPSTTVPFAIPFELTESGGTISGLGVTGTAAGTNVSMNVFIAWPVAAPSLTITGTATGTISGTGSSTAISGSFTGTGSFSGINVNGAGNYSATDCSPPSSSGSATTFICSVPSMNYCWDWTNATSISSAGIVYAQNECTSGDGAYYGLTACPTANLLGTCTFSRTFTPVAGVTVSESLYYYSGYGGAQQNCQGQNGTWTPYLSNVDSVVSIAAGDYSTCAVVNGGVWCWARTPMASSGTTPRSGVRCPFRYQACLAVAASRPSSKATRSPARS